MANAHVCPLLFLFEFRKELTKEVEAKRLHPAIRNRRFQHAVRFIHAVFDELEIIENFENDPPCLEFKNKTTRGSPVQRVEEYLKAP